MNIGIDLGSRTVKIVFLNKENQLVKSKIFDSIEFYRTFHKQTNNNSFCLDVSKLGICEQDRIVATGYGKHGIHIEGIETISEQKAHVLGAMHQVNLLDFVLLDIGGQDTKIIKVIDGKMLDVYMNDKCGASSGRYLENMSGVLKISIDELSKYYKNPEKLSNTCAVFGESEVLGKIFEGISIEQIAAGVNYSVFERISSILSKMVDSNPIIFVGGVSKNQSIIKFIEGEFKVEVIIPKYEQLNGAIGAAIFKK